MLVHGYVPSAFGSGIIIRLLKDANLDKTNMDNYRAMSPVKLMNRDVHKFFVAVTILTGIKKLFAVVRWNETLSSS